MTGEIVWNRRADHLRETAPLPAKPPYYGHGSLPAQISAQVFIDDADLWWWNVHQVVLTAELEHLCTITAASGQAESERLAVAAAESKLRALVDDPLPVW